ncbi:MAG TPA: TIGR03619 family F420-dependent LLM class oxidoreductase [Solirubrobacteraceae bacterium]|jgi:probable F420-dependent oxidoreductase|nr:TIGR03619 family F420-dependent LLM class oxidoreductase [Solirubrobacteraceae bacterium]
MRIGISERFGMPGHDLAHLTRIARAIEARGFDSYWTPEHLAVCAGAPEVLTDAPSFPDPFVNLTAVAAATSQILLGTAVLLAPLQHPLAIARAGASLDAISGGRFVLGAGVGWEPMEYAALGVPWQARGERASEHLEAVLALWREQPASHAGPYVAFDSAIGEPRPLRRPGRPHPPLLVGGNSDAALQRAARLGDGWFGWGLEREALGRALRKLRELLSATGREAGDFTLQLGIRFDGDRERLERYAREARAMGIDRLVVTCGPEGTVDEDRLDAIAGACAPRQEDA